MTHLRNIDISTKDVKEFQRIYLKVFGEKIDFDEAEREARRFLRFMSVVMK